MHVKKLKMLVKKDYLSPGGQNVPNFGTVCFPEIRIPLGRGPALGEKLAGDALVPQVCTRLKISVKFEHCGPGGQNGPKF